MLAAQARFTVPATVWGSFLRLATNRRIFEVPTPRAEAFVFAEAVTAQPAHLNVGPGPGTSRWSARCARKPTRSATSSRTR